jgi:hypothetical protein
MDCLRPRRLLRSCLLLNGLPLDLGFAGLLFLALLQFPAFVAGRDLDESWQQAYGEFLKNNAQAGVDYAYTFGPLGYFYGRAYERAFFWQYYGWAIGLSLSVVTITVLAGRRIAALDLRCFFYLLWIMVVAPYRDSVLELAIYEIAFLLFVSQPRPPILLIALIFLAITSLIKFTLAVEALTAVSLLSACSILEMRRFRGAVVLLLYLGSCLLLWMLVGQSLYSLPAYLQNSLELSHGYAEGMRSDGANPTIVSSLAIAGALALVCILLPWRRPLQARPLLLSLFSLLMLFLQWKHGYVRDDNGHVSLFLAFVTILPFILVAFDLKVLNRGSVRFACATAVLLSIWSLQSLQRDLLISPNKFGRMAFKQLRQQAEYLMHPDRLQAQLEEVRARVSEQYQLREIKARVGDRSVDLVSCEQGVLFLNKLHWTPRPVFQSYCAFTEQLLCINTKFYQGPRAPHFVLLKLTPIDGHFPALEDCGVLLQLLTNYQPRLREKGYLLLEHCPQEPEPESERAVRCDRRLVRLGEEVQVSSAAGEYQTLSLRVELTAAGKLLQSVYRPPIVTIHVTTTHGEKKDYRLIPGMASSSFLLNPLIQTTDDFLQLYLPEEGKRVASFSITADPYLGIKAYRCDIQMALTRYQFPARESSAAVLQRLRYPMLATPPQSVTAPHVHEVDYDGTSCLMVHAPGTVSYDQSMNSHYLEARFGILPGAYTGEGQVDGLEFSVVHVPAHGPPAVLWRRVLDPLRVPKDRGIQSIHVDLPTWTPDCRLELNTRALPGHKADWGWSFWTRVLLK